MIRKAEDWFEEELSGEPLTQDSVTECIKMVQEEVIRKTVKECLNTCAYVNYPMEDSRRLCGEITTKENILQVADKLIKEL